MSSNEFAGSRFALPRRLWLLLLALAAENTVVVQLPHPWFNMYLYRGLPIVFGLALVFFGLPQFRTVFVERRGLQTLPFGTHLATLALLATLEAVLLLHFGAAPAGLGLRITVWLWLALFPVLAATLILSFLPMARVLALGRALGASWLYAAVASALVVLLRERFRLAWSTSSSRIGSAALAAAFHQTHALLRLFYPVVVQDPATHILGTPNFLVIVGGTCSGLEGMALMTAFSAVWLVYARRELRIARALLLVPVALALMWALNLVRLVSLIAIGDAGHPEIATQGFHSEAGWIAFNLVSLAFLFTAQRIPWFRKPVSATAAIRPRSDGYQGVNLPAMYLGPFLAITAAAVVSQAASAGFDRLYPLRLVAALSVLWIYQREYRRLDWRFGWLGPAGGVLVAVLWLALHHLLAVTHHLPTASDPTPAGLADSSRLGAAVWITIRVLAAVITVPIAEELAFRGYLARRFTSPDLERVPFSRLGAWAIVGSSLAFGIVHGHMWLAGILAGFVFAEVAKRKNRFGEAVAAHAVANLCLAIVAVMRHDFSLW